MKTRLHTRWMMGPRRPWGWRRWRGGFGWGWGPRPFRRPFGMFWGCGGLLLLVGLCMFAMMFARVFIRLR